MHVLVSATSRPSSLYDAEPASCRQSLLSSPLPSSVNPDNLEFGAGQSGAALENGRKLQLRSRFLCKFTFSGHLVLRYYSPSSLCSVGDLFRNNLTTLQ